MESLVCILSEDIPLPPPWDISVIKPEMKFCMRGKDDVSFKFEDKTEKLFLVEHIRSAKRFIFVAHGFLRTIETEWLTTLKNAVLDYERTTSGENSCVVIVGWGGGANLAQFQYPQAAANTETVGAWVGDRAKDIWKWSRRITIRRAFQGSSRSPSAAEIIGIGHSLGAHLMGAAGRKSQVFDVITGLDPAGPWFETSNTDKRLSNNAAKFVQVIHTDGFYTYLYMGKNHYGTLEPLGHLDFYPNWGYEQPGLTSTIGGSHGVVVDLFIWSITHPGKFVTNKMLRHRPKANEKPELKWAEQSAKVEMGYHVSKEGRGCYYIRTNAKAPWDDFLSGPDPKVWEEQREEEL